MILSFGWTWPAYVAGVKNCTRRDWHPAYARRFKLGRGHTAVSKQLCWGGQRIGTFKLAREPYLEETKDIPDSDYKAEGFEYLDGIKFYPLELKRRGFRTWWQFFEAWRTSEECLYVVRFKPLPYTREGKEMVPCLFHPPGVKP